MKINFLIIVILILAPSLNLIKRLRLNSSKSSLEYELSEPYKIFYLKDGDSKVKEFGEEDINYYKEMTDPKKYLSVKNIFYQAFINEHTPECLSSEQKEFLKNKAIEKQLPLEDFITIVHELLIGLDLPNCKFNEADYLRTKTIKNINCDGCPTIKKLKKEIEDEVKKPKPICPPQDPCKGCDEEINNINDLIDKMKLNIKIKCEKQKKEVDNCEGCEIEEKKKELKKEKERENYLKNAEPPEDFIKVICPDECCKEKKKENNYKPVFGYFYLYPNPESNGIKYPLKSFYYSKGYLYISTEKEIKEIGQVSWLKKDKQKENTYKIFRAAKGPQLFDKKYEKHNGIYFKDIRRDGLPKVDGEVVLLSKDIETVEKLVMPIFKSWTRDEKELEKLANKYFPK